MLAQTFSGGLELAELAIILGVMFGPLVIGLTIVRANQRRQRAKLDQLAPPASWPTDQHRRHQRTSRRGPRYSLATGGSAVFNDALASARGTCRSTKTMQNFSSSEPNIQPLGCWAELFVLPVSFRLRTSEPRPASEVMVF